jgi:hypothetical protein
VPCRAKAKGVKLGRKPKLTEHQCKDAIRRRDKGEESLAEIGRSYNVSGWTIGRLAIDSENPLWHAARETHEASAAGHGLQSTRPRPSIALPHVDNDGDFCERGGGP